MMYLFTLEQLAERGYSIYCSQVTKKWHWLGYCMPASFGATKAEAIAAASAHCRENYVPPRPDGVPERAEFRLPKKGDTLLTGRGNITTENGHNWQSIDYDEFGFRRWCWREEEEKPKAGEEPKIDNPTLADLELKAQLVMAQNQLEAVQRAIDTLKDQRCVSLDDAFRIIGAVRAIHDAKGWEE